MINNVVVVNIFPSPLLFYNNNSLSQPPAEKQERSLTGRGKNFLEKYDTNKGDLYRAY